jgi:hypothetical protein
VFSHDAGKDAGPRLARAAIEIPVAFQSPSDVNESNVWFEECHLYIGCCPYTVFELHGVARRMVFLERLFTFPPISCNADEVSIGGKKRRQGFYVV